MSGRKYRYVIPGPAVPQGRPRLTTAGGHPRAYDPPKSREYKAYVQRCVREQGAPKTPITGAVFLRVYEYRAIPKSWSRRKKQAAREGTLWPTSRPDLDNVKKAVQDALNGLVWKDDAQVVWCMGSKAYGEDPRVEVQISEFCVDGV
ncbi:MAG: RusA family crossover junction endodeoxyribonuclease [Oscillospiraceae bacterium]|nr:RusA family crossover junction endodeoxyribonuclease [Oscillospiraceae bacterium]